MSAEGFYTERYRLWFERPRDAFLLEDVTTGQQFPIQNGHMTSVIEMMVRMVNAGWFEDGGRVHSTADHQQHEGG